ncbi:energy transducer TonB [Adhaeribacter soli]|uniref:Energy transducer TonB n=1 Tax=Adhaeribacter soli TaxID=2607655 RepID=A0A5N1ILI7_9BACT|nr:energy transducer TonB [Adhaeribacter soli]KAA9327327.1 energy transducer TonB [Adhaeribacter soli]
MANHSENFLKPSLSFNCPKDWNKMSPCAQGRFCGSCQKTVVDFTQKTDAEIREILAKQEGKVCGRFYEYQLEQPVQNRFSFRRVFSSVFVLLGLSFLSKEADAQTNKSITSKPPNNSCKSNQPPALLGFVTPVIKKSSENNFNSEKVYDFVETMPEFKEGGATGLKIFFDQKINYSQILLTYQGTVIIQFIVDENGKVKEPVILKGLNTYADKEALRLANLLKFNPGIQNGKRVKVRYILPIQFSRKTSNPSYFWNP